MNGAADLVVAVRLKADNSGLVGQTRVAVAEVEALGGAAVAAGNQARTLAAGTNEAANAARSMAGASSQATAASGSLAASQIQAAAAGDRVIVSAGQQRAAYQQLSFQITDIIQSLALGVNPAVVFAQQAGQVAQAFALMGGGGAGGGGGAAGQAASAVSDMGSALDSVTGTIESTKGAASALAGVIGAETGATNASSAAAGANATARTGQIGTITGATTATEVNSVATAGNVAALEANAIATGQLAATKASFATFLGGPYGAALIGVITILGLMVPKLFEAGNATEETGKKLEQAAAAADSFGSAQSMLGKVVDLTTGKLKTQNSVLVQSIRLQAQLNLEQSRGQLAKLTGANQGVTLVAPKPGTTGVMGIGGGDIDASVRAARQVADQKKQLDEIRKSLGTVVNDSAFAQRDPQNYSETVSKAIDTAIAKVDRLAVGGQLAGKNLTDVKLGILEIGRAAQDQASALQSLDVLNGGPVPENLTPYSRDKKPPRPKRAPSTEARDEFGRDAEDRIAAITEAFDETPTAVRQAERAVRQLDDLIDDLGRKKPPNFEALIASAQEAKSVVGEGLIRTIADAFEAPETLAIKAGKAVGQLDQVIARLGKAKPAGFEGLIADAEEAKRAIAEGLNRPLTDYLEAQQGALQIQQLLVAGKEDEAEAQRVILQLEQQMGPLGPARKDAVLATVQALRAEQRELDVLRQKQQAYLSALGDIRSTIVSTIEHGADGLKELPNQLFDVFKRFQAEWLTEKLFGPALRELEAQVTGTNVVKDASARMAAAVDDVKGSIDSFGDALDAFVQRQKTATPSTDPTQPAAQSFGNQISDVVGDEGEIVVTGRVEADVPKGVELTNAQDFFGNALGKTLAPLFKAIGLDPDTTKSLSDFIGKSVGAVMQGIAEGQMASGIASMLGIKQSSTGATIGGGIGGIASMITGIPGLGALGGLLGGTIGGLFMRPKYGTASVSSATRDADVTGSNGGLQRTAGGLADQVQSGLRQISEQLGGALGSFSLAIGTWNDRFRVNTEATNKELHSKNFGNTTLFDFGDDEAAAISFAIADAIKDGAVKGLSSAVQAALKSSTDVQEALDEALKVADIERLIGGVGAELKHAFDQFDRTAAERVDLAKKYGLDLLQVERINAEQRADLLDETLKSRVGALQDFLDNVRYGDLFEGSAAERRTQILGEIDEAKEDAEAGVEGAADRLAALYRQLTETSRDAFGTSGPEYASDRAAAIAGVERVIQIEQDRVAAAAAATQAQTQAILDGNSLTDETNDLLAITNARLDRLAQALEQSGLSGSAAAELALTARGVTA